MAKAKITRSSIERLPIPAGKPVYYFDELLTGYGVRVSPRGVRTYFVQGRVRGRLHRHTLGRFPAVKPDEARDRAREMLSNMAAGAAPDRKCDQVTVTDALDEWLTTHVKHKLKPRTALDYEVIATRVLKPALGDRAMLEIERADLAKLHNERRETPRRANYILAVARSFFSFAEDAGHRKRDTNPAKRIRAYPENRRERFLSTDELARASAAISAAEQSGEISIFAAAALRLCILTGARQGELRALRWREVDIERRMLLLEDSKTGRRPIYLSEPALEILTALPRIVGNDHVFPGDKPGDHYRNLTRAWIKVRKRAGLGDVRLHDLRHTFASFGAADSMSLPMIGRLLGHRVPATTARYAHLASDPVVAANDRLGRRLAHAMNGTTETSAPAPVAAGALDATQSGK